MSNFKNFDFIGSNDKDYDFFLSFGTDGSDGNGIMAVGTKYDPERAENYPQGILPAEASVEFFNNDAVEKEMNRYPNLADEPELRTASDPSEYEMIEELAAAHGVEPYPHDVNEDASYAEMAEDEQSMLPRTVDAIEKDGKACAVMLGIDYAQHYGRGPVLNGDPDAFRITYTAIDPVTGQDGLSKDERDTLMQDRDNLAGIVSIDVDKLKKMYPMEDLSTPEAQHRVLCDLVNDASQNPVQLPVLHYFEDFSMKYSVDVMSRDSEALNGIVDTSKFIGSYDSVEEMLLDNVDKFPVAQKMARIAAAGKPVLQAKLDHKLAQIHPTQAISKERTSRKQDDMER